MTKQSIKKDYKQAVLGLSIALELLVFEFNMTKGEAFRYLHR